MGWGVDSFLEETITKCIPEGGERGEMGTGRTQPREGGKRTV